MKTCVWTVKLSFLIEWFLNFTTWRSAINLIKYTCTRRTWSKNKWKNLINPTSKMTNWMKILEISLHGRKIILHCANCISKKDFSPKVVFQCVRIEVSFQNYFSSKNWKFFQVQCNRTFCLQQNHPNQKNLIPIFDYFPFLLNCL